MIVVEWGATDRSWFCRAGAEERRLRDTVASCVMKVGTMMCNLQIDVAVEWVGGREAFFGRKQGEGD